MLDKVICLKAQVCRLEVLLDPGLLLEVQVMMMARSVFNQFHWPLPPFLSTRNLATITLISPKIDTILQGCP